MVILDAGPLAAGTWAPFGWLPVGDTDPSDGDGTLEFQWADPHLNVMAHARDEVDWVDGQPVCARFYRHATHTQGLMSLNTDAVIAVAPAGVELSEPADLDAMRAFRVAPLDCLVLARGTWHWGPFPLGPEPVRLLNLQGRRYEEDSAYVDIGPALDVLVAVRP
jgi:hypothetical protein